MTELSEIVFDVTEAVEGGFDARGLGHDILTQGEDWSNLKSMAKDAVRCHFDDDVCRIIWLYLVKDEIITA